MKTQEENSFSVYCPEVQLNKVFDKSEEFQHESVYDSFGFSASICEHHSSQSVAGG